MFDVPSRRLDVELSDAQLAERLAGWTAADAALHDGRHGEIREAGVVGGVGSGHG